MIDCSQGGCKTPRWMAWVLCIAGIYQILFGLWVNLWPKAFFVLMGCDQPNHPMMWKGVGLISIIFGIGYLISTRNPIRHWTLILIGFIKINIALCLAVVSLINQSLPLEFAVFVALDDLIWWFPFAAILWAAAQAHAGYPPSNREPLSIQQAAETYRLSTDETLASASEKNVIVMVFLRHFGCTFTRKILRELEQLKAQADEHNARLVLVHMLSPGREKQYIQGRNSEVARIADPMCELYRAFGLGKGGFWELFGPKVWYPLIKALLKGCGVGQVAGDGLQLPGAFLFHKGKIISSQRARTQAELPDLPRLFEGLSDHPKDEKVEA